MNAFIHARKYSLVFLSLLGLLSFTSCKSESSNIEIEGIDGPHVQLLEDNLLISMVVENMVLDGGLRYNIPKYPNSYVEISPDLQSSGTLLSVSVSLDDVFDDRLGNLDPQRLPGGRALPGVAGGQLPAVAFSIQKFHNMSLYVGPEVFGVFVPADLGIDGAIATFSYYMNDKKAGNVSVVGNDQDGENGGILLLLNMKGKLKKKLMKRAKKY
ncbi:hypothetical protein [Halobacteriovorax sp. JY17]|uniref:hypothetical protein n=1 Tax=Halobacteriovorax sp. JY17 TaxID=2014617 RepID=UPI000C466BEF|nr:hypothetical protein [Halobacteriovorax sp. JY17]PIK15274.1 MAG: hypothetical protein CES88_00765 [Halobacteriovorax sp. JY17]